MLRLRSGFGLLPSPQPVSFDALFFVHSFSSLVYQSRFSISMGRVVCCAVSREMLSPCRQAAFTFLPSLRLSFRLSPRLASEVWRSIDLRIIDATI